MRGELSGGDGGEYRRFLKELMDLKNLGATAPFAAKMQVLTAC